MTWTTLDLIVAFASGLTFGASGALLLKVYAAQLEAWVRERHFRRKRRSLEERLRVLWNLSEDQVEAAVVAHDRWQRGRCPFCGADGEDFDICCDVQADFKRDLYCRTWHIEDFDELLDYVFGEARDLRAEG